MPEPAIVEQAVFASVRSRRGSGYQLAATSDGVCEEQRRELSAWGPSHDSLWLEDGTCLSFHPLPRGFAVSVSSLAGREYSGRGRQVYTQTLVVRGEVLRRFANNPFALYLAARRQGHLRVCDQTPRHLPPVELHGRAEAVDEEFMATLAGRVGAERLAALVEAALTHNPLALRAGDQGAALVAGLFNLLPVDCRTELSFTTGLRFSPRRPFRAICLGDSGDDLRRFTRQHGEALFCLSGSRSGENATACGWANLARRVAETGRWRPFAERLARLEQDLRLADLRRGDFSPAPPEASTSSPCRA